jgi:hypothetical protein
MPRTIIAPSLFLAGFMLGTMTVNTPRNFESTMLSVGTLKCPNTSKLLMETDDDRLSAGQQPLVRPSAKNYDHPSIASFVVPLPRAAAPEYEGKYFSQYGQDKLVDSLLNQTTSGFFVESGAYNGVELSNSLFFEATRKWKGLLIEANPYLYREIIDQSSRKANVIHACLSPTTQASSLPFKLGGPIGGLVNYVEDGQLQRIAAEISRKEPWMDGDQGSGKEISVNCWPLRSMLSVLNIQRIDYWSLDIEGSEPDVLESTDFDALDIRVLTIEVNSAKAEEQVKNIMAKKKNYRLHSKFHIDLVYIKEGV